MRPTCLCFVALWLAVVAAPAPASAQQTAVQPAATAQPAAAATAVPAQVPALPSVTVCGQQRAPLAQPPAGSPPVVLFVAPCFAAQGGTSVIDSQTYVFYMQVAGKISAPSQGTWIPYDDSIEKIMHDDFTRLLGTGFLDNLSIETAPDYVFPNGTIGKVVLYNMEERQRIKIGPNYEGSKKLEIAKIDEALKANMAEIRLDTFIDPGLVRKVEGIVRDMMKEKGFTDAEVTHEIKEVAGGPKLVSLTFNINEGPSVKIRKIDFIGNNAISDGTLRHQMKSTKQQWFLSFLNGRGTYQETKFDDDAGKVVEFYQNRGYIKANVGAPEAKVVAESKDKKTRWIELRIPVTEGPRYKVGTFDFSGNTVVKSEALKPYFNLKEGDYYSLDKVRKGLDKAREGYGAGGYFEFTGFPDYKFRDEPDPTADAAVPEALKPAATGSTAGGPAGPPIVDVTMRLVEGQQYRINRITFIGNTTTHDNVIRRELRIFENNVFDTEALKYSVRRLNQLGYFKPLEAGKDITVDKTPGTTDKVDVKVKLEEQNRNQISFGAGISEFEGFFGQASFQTSNFLGRGESLTVSLSAGSRAQNYTLAFTEPFLFDRNMTGSINLYRNDIRYIGQFTQRSAGGVVGFGYPLGGFTRLFTNYSYERVRVTEINAAYTDPVVLARNPFLRDSLLIGANGERIISKITPSLVHNTVDQPIFPNAGVRYTAAIDLAGIGGNTSFYKPSLEGIWYWRQAPRLSLGLRAMTEYIHAYSNSRDLPIFQKIFLGGEYSVRGYDIRSIGPQDPGTGLVLGGNKDLLFNVEQNINIMSQLRVILFYDAGQVRDVGQSFALKETLVRRVIPPLPLLYDPNFDPRAFLGPTDPPTISTSVSAFKTSTGVEVRLFMPVINVPFRLIFAYNPQRAGVLSNSTLLPQKPFQFRFAVGTTF